MDYFDLLQWPAMLITVTAAWLVASRKSGKREIGFWLFLLSNVLWVVWGYHDHAYALITLQVALALINIRGAYKNDSHVDRDVIGDRQSNTVESRIPPG